MTDGTSSTAIQLTGNVYGDADTGPSGHVTFGSQAYIGATFDSTQRSHTEGTGETKGWITHDFTTTFSDVALPSELTTASNLGSMNGGTIISGDYKANSLKTSSSGSPI